MDSMIVIAVAGAVGGLLKSLVEQHGAVALPTIEETDGVKYVHLGGIANLIIGSVIALYIADTPSTAILAGISSAFIAEKIIERAKELPIQIKLPISK